MGFGGHTRCAFPPPIPANKSINVNLCLFIFIPILVQSYKNPTELKLPVFEIFVFADKSSTFMCQTTTHPRVNAFIDMVLSGDIPEVDEE